MYFINIHCTYIAELFKEQWRRPSKQGAEIRPRVFQLDKNSATFQKYYDEIQSAMKSIAGTDEFLTGKRNISIAWLHVFCQAGMLSKS